MKTLLTTAFALVLGSTSLALEAAKKPLAFTDVAVIDATGAPLKEHLTVIVTDGRISAVAGSDSVKIPQEAEVVNATGKFLIPGLWDMHVHLSWTKASALPALVANGVTSVRDAGGDLDEIDRWRQQIRDGTLTGPHIVRAGPVVDGPKPGSSYRATVRNEADAREAVQTLKQRGVDIIKIHNAVPREAYFALADECRRTGIRFFGHVPKTISLQEACEAGQSSLEHMDTFVEGVLAANAQKHSESVVAVLRQFAEDGAPQLFQCLARHNLAVTPTLIRTFTVNQLMETHAETDPRSKYLSASAKQLSDRYLPLTAQIPPQEIAQRKEMFPEFQKLVLAMQRAGVTLLVGTDLAGRGVYPGFSMHDELTQLVAAGLTPLEALQAATRNPAKYLGRITDLGTIEKGKIADLVLLDANPLENVQNTTKIRAVVLGGRYCDRADLDRLLAEAEAAARE